MADSYIIECHQQSPKKSFRELVIFHPCYPNITLTSCADVTRGVRCPGDPVDACSVVVEPRHGRARHPHVEDDDLARVHGDGGQVVGVLGGSLIDLLKTAPKFSQKMIF